MKKGNRKFLVGITGSTGLIGKNLIKKYPKYKFIKFEGDILNKRQVDNWIANSKFNKLIHLAAKVPTAYVNANYLNSKKTNYEGTKNLINSILKFKYKKFKWFFFASTSHVYKESKKKLKENSRLKPYSKYGYTKLLAERFLKRKTPFKICIARIFSITHPKQHPSYAIPSIYKKISKSKNNEVLVLKNLNHNRDFCHINDVCRAIDLLCKKEIEGTYNIGSSKKISLKYIASFFAKKKKLIFVDNKLESNIVANISRIKKIGFKPRFNLEKTLQDFK